MNFSFKTVAASLVTAVVIVEAGLSLYTEISPDTYRNVVIETCRPLKTSAAQRMFLSTPDEKVTVEGMIVDGDQLRARTFIMDRKKAEKLDLYKNPLSKKATIITKGQFIAPIVSPRVVSMTCSDTTQEERDQIKALKEKRPPNKRFLFQMMRDHRK